MILFTRFYDPGSARKLILADPLHSILYDVFGVDLMAIENHVLVMLMLSAICNFMLRENRVIMSTRCGTIHGRSFLSFV